MLMWQVKPVAPLQRLPVYTVIGFRNVFFSPPLAHLHLLFSVHLPPLWRWAAGLQQ